MITLSQAYDIVSILEDRVESAGPKGGLLYNPGQMYERELIHEEYLRHGHAKNWCEGAHSSALRQARAEWLYRHLGGERDL